jgi:LPXTG-motif cell wall-anchored protein
MPGRFLLPLATVAGVVLLGMAPAPAQEPYPPAPPRLSVSTGTVVVGGSVVLTGAGFVPREEIMIGVSTVPLATPGAVLDATADAGGNFTAAVTLTEPGRTTITVTGRTSGISGSVVVTVLAPGETLPETGGSGRSLLRIGGAVLAAGVVLLLVGLLRWRRREHLPPG